MPLCEPPSPIAVFIVDFIHGYGSERYALQLVNALAQRHAAVDLLLQKRGDTLVHTVDPRVRIHEIGTYNPFRTVLFLCRYLRKNRPLALLGIMEKPSLLAIVASFLARYKNTVPTVHLDIDAYANQEHSTRRRVLRRLVSFFYRFTPAIVSVSNGVAEVLRRWVGPKTRMVTILNGFDLPMLRARAKEPVDNPWLNEKTVPVVIGCGRFVPLKGMEILIRAFARVRQQGPAKLILLGEGQERPHLEALVRELGLQDDVALPGYADNPQAWFARSDVFVLSSRAEGFGNVLVEAMAAGVPVVSTRCPSGPSEILNEGAYGELVPVDDAQAMAEAIARSLKSPRDASAQQRQQAYLDSHFSVAAMAQGYLDLIQTLPSPSLPASKRP